MSLERYKQKRDFRKTPEPKARKAKTHTKPIFVIQEHHASRLHYDFRLEADGVLKSWAVPKEPTLDPSQKRLAVQVEDHPLEYGTFEGTIPEGEYGAGTVKIWDHGTYENLMEQKEKPLSLSQSIAAGHVEVLLHGKALKGKFALIRMQGRMGGKPGKENWLLIKMKDEHADSEGDGRPARRGARREASADGKRQAPKREKKERSRAAPRSGKKSKPPAEFDEFTHTDRVMFPEAGITKGDVLEFYDKIAPRLLPYLKDRPVTLERMPEGIAGSVHFWQKDTPESYPDWIPRVALPTEAGKTVHYALVNDTSTLLYLVNQGTLTFHVWMSRVQDLDRPDFVLFDLDPGKATLASTVAVARRVHEALDEEKREAFVKTSGKRGLHVLVRWDGKGGYDQARAWALEISTRVAGEMADQATTEIRKAKRGRKVYIDVMQNARGHHAVPPYVLRPVPGAPVSTPLDWDDLTPDLDPSAFNLKKIFRRLAHQKADPMAGLLPRRRPRGRKSS